MEYAGLVVADDLTGAMDTGNEFAGRGYATTVALGASVDDRDASVAVANTGSRYLSEVEAADAVRAAVRAHPADVVYKKVDSTLRGNLVAEIDAAVAETNAALAVVAPAFPANGRTTEDGTHLVDGTPVAETAAGRDPDKPVPTSHLPTLLEACTHPLARLPASRVAGGPDAVADALREVASGGTGRIVTCDAADEEALATIARGAAVSGLDIVYVGSAGLARYVDVPGERPMDGGERPTRNPLTGRARPDEVRDDGNRVLGIAGSTNPATVEQVREVSDERTAHLDLRRAVLDPTTAVDDAAARCLDRLREGDSVLLTTVGGEPEAGLRAGRERGLPERDVRTRISAALSDVARRIHRRVGVTGFFVTGGAVAVDVLGALGTEGIRLTGEEVGSGVPIGWLVGGEAAGTPVVTKAGAFGDPGTIHNCLACLRHDDE